MTLAKAGPVHSFLAGGYCDRAGEGILVVSTTEVSLPLQAALEISQKETHQSGA